jgi:hypothetical protein
VISAFADGGQLKEALACFLAIHPPQTTNELRQNPLVREAFPVDGDHHLLAAYNVPIALYVSLEFAEFLNAMVEGGFVQATPANFKYQRPIRLCLVPASKSLGPWHSLPKAGPLFHHGYVQPRRLDLFWRDGPRKVSLW